MTETHPKLENAMAGCFRASRCLRFWCNRPVKALEIVKQFHGLEMPEGAEKRRYDLVMSCICSTTGNCYLIMKQPTEAAKWYRKAAQHYKGGRYVPLYARTVFRHRLAEHYQTALECMKEDSERFGELPLILKVFSYACWGWQLHPRLWRLMLTEGRLSRRLQKRIDIVE